MDFTRNGRFFGRMVGTHLYLGCRKWQEVQAFSQKDEFRLSQDPVVYPNVSPIEM